MLPQTEFSELAPSQTNSPSPCGDKRQQGAVTVRVLRTLPELESIRSIWTLWQRHPNSDIDFYLQVLAMRPGSRPHVLVLYRDGRPEAMLIGRACEEQIECRIGYRVLWRPRKRHLTFIYGGQLGNFSPENCEAFVQEINDSLRRDEAVVAWLHFVKEGSPLCELARHSSSLLCRDYSPSVQVHRSTILQDSVEAFYQTLSPKVRKNQKWQAKKILQHFGGNVTIRCFRENTELDCMFQDVEEVAKKTYQRGMGVGFQTNHEMRERFQLQAGKGWLRAYVLYLESVPAAFWIGDVYQQVFHSHFMGYDPAFAKHSPGMYLVMQTVEGFCAEDEVREIDWGLGDAQYKEVLGTSEWMEASFYLFAPTVSGLTLNLMRTPAALVDDLAKSALAHSSLLSRIKKSWRGSLRKGNS